MRFLNLNVRTAALSFLIVGMCGCGASKRPVELLPPASVPNPKAAAKTSAPAIALETTQPAVAANPRTQADDQKEGAGHPSATTQAQTEGEPVLDAVADLVARAEKEYQGGLANYRAGKMAEAKQNFDRALDALLSSNLDVRSDDRLEKEFDRIVQGVNEVYPGGTSGEAEVAQEPQQKSEPAPIDETNGLCRFSSKRAFHRS